MPRPTSTPDLTHHAHLISQDTPARTGGKDKLPASKDKLVDSEITLPSTQHHELRDKQIEESEIIYPIRLSNSLII